LGSRPQPCWLATDSRTICFFNRHGFLEGQPGFKFAHGEDFFKAQFHDAALVTLYLLTQVNGYLDPEIN